MISEPKVTVNLSGIKQYARQVPDKTRRIFELWTIRYRTWIQRRFNEFSRGSGDWPPLKYREGSILRQTNTLYTALTPSLVAPPGSVNIFEPNSVEIGFGGSESHPGGPTIAQIALWHQTGAGKLPVREIIVVPPQSLINQMAQDADRILNS